MTNTANWDRAKDLYPSTTQLTEQDWVEFFDSRPDAMHAILGDIFVITKAHHSEVKKSGRRPRHVNGNLDELWEMITPKYSVEPFPEAMKELIGNQSIRSFAAKIPMHYWSLIRLIRGERRIITSDIASSLKTLEMIAKAGQVHPFYFREYRTLYILNAFADVFTAKPNITIGISRKLNNIENQ